MADFTITLNGTAHGGLDGYVPTKRTIVTNAGRNINNGDAYADKKADKVTLNLNFRNRTEAQAAAIESDTTLAAYFFSVTYRDVDGSSVAGTFYRSDIEFTPVRYNATTGEFTYDVKLNLIEQ
jgi:phage repressor protein C with HTH and peptisase S24 domain